MESIRAILFLVNGSRASPGSPEQTGMLLGSCLCVPLRRKHSLKAFSASSRTEECGGCCYRCSH